MAASASPATFLRSSAPPALATPTTTVSKGVRTVQFVPPERWVNVDATPTYNRSVNADVCLDSPRRSISRTATLTERSPWAHLGPITGIDDDGDAMSAAMVTPTLLTPTRAQQSLGTMSAPLSAFRAQRKSVTLASPVGSFASPMTHFPSPVASYASPAGAPQLVLNGTQSMPMANMLRTARSPGSTKAPSMPSTPAVTPVPSMPSTPAKAVAPVGAVRMPRASTQEHEVLRDASASRPLPVPAKKDRIKRRYKTVDFSGAHLTRDVKVGVVAPGGGTGMNAPVYRKLGNRDDISLEILGQSRAPYDRYTEAWGPPSGGPPPNLESFAVELLNQGVCGRCDCLVVGSRGGQVCLPTFWRHAGAQVPPTVVLNGGCGMQLPIQVPWPDSAVTFLVLGGQDYFRQQFSLEQYLADARSRVPRNNTTTAIMLVNEMAHMPQTQLLDAILHSLIKAVTFWKENEEIPTEDFDHIVAAVTALGFHGKLIYKTGPGDVWHETNIPEIALGPTGIRPQTRHATVTVMRRAAPIYND